MSSLIKHVEGRTTNYIVPLNKTFDDHPGFLDATDWIVIAIRRDKRHDYPAENGPHYAMAKRQAEEYAAYVAEYAQRDNLHKFDTRAFRSFIGSLTETEVKDRMAA